MNDDRGTSGPGRERTLDVECTSTGRIVPPGIEVGKPGKLADTMSRVDQGPTPSAVTTLRAVSALRMGEASGLAVDRTTGSPQAATLGPLFHSGSQSRDPSVIGCHPRFHSAAQRLGLAVDDVTVHPQPSYASVTLRPQPVCSGENEVFENVSQTNVSISDMEVESNFSEFEMSNPVRSSTVVNQFDSAAQRLSLIHISEPTRPY